MKKKILVVSVLTALLLAGIIALQVYWSFTSYKLNKEKFDGDVNVALQRAMDSCKRDYFDSIRVVMVKRLSDTGTTIKLDTIRNQDTAHPLLSISIANKYTGMSQPLQTTIADFDFYRRKIPHTATIPEVVTEMSFYVPRLLDDVEMLLSFEDISSHLGQLKAFLKAHSNEPSDSVMKHNNIIQSGTYELPVNYRKADSIKLSKYLREEIRKTHRYANFELKFSDKPLAATAPDPHKVNQLRYSETDEVIYKYHGFIPLQHTTKNWLYVRAIFERAQVGLLKEMIASLLAAGILIVFTIFCMGYIIYTINKQRKLAELKDDFINNMTHELKTPIATATVAIEGLQKFNGHNDPEKTQRYLQTSRNELSRLNDLVNKVLSVATFETQEVNLTKESIKLNELMAEVIEAEKLKSPKQVNISYNNKDNVEKLKADRLHFRNVLVNLIDNAIKYSTEPVEIAIDVKKENGFAVFAIKDNGVGIPPSHLKQVFEKFHRVPSGNVHNVKGTGLGLSYVKYIVEAHGGEVKVNSEVNKGSELVVKLPLNG